MKNYKKLNRLYESVEMPELSQEIANCGLSEFMTKLEACCANDTSLSDKLDSLKTLVSDICAQPAVMTAFGPDAEPVMEPNIEPTMEPTSQAEPAISEPVPTFGEFTQGSPNQEYNVPTFGA